MRESFLAVLILLSAGTTHAQMSPTPVPDIPEVSAEVALSSFMALSDGYLKKMADSLQILAMSESARTGDWKRIRVPLQEVAEKNVEAVNWFALPDGSYWTLEEGRTAENLKDRAYFPGLMSGETILGELVVSKSTRKSSAIVAVPVLDKDGLVIGALGASIDLDRLSARLSHEMGVDETMIYYSFDSEPRLGIVWDPVLTLMDPERLGNEVSEAFEEMLKKPEGIQSYTFRGKRRTVLFRRSPVTGWRYAFGIVLDGRE